MPLLRALFLILTIPTALVRSYSSEELLDTRSPPSFNPNTQLNYTFQQEERVELYCEVDNLGYHIVTWKFSGKKIEDGYDSGYQIYHPGELRIYNIQVKHAGEYDCSVNTDPPLVRKIHVKVIPLTITRGRILGRSKKLFMEEGSDLSLTCEITMSGGEEGVNYTLPTHAEWSWRNAQLNDSRVSQAQVIPPGSNNTLLLYLTITNLSVSDGSYFTCDWNLPRESWTVKRDTVTLKILTHSAYQEQYNPIPHPVPMGKVFWKHCPGVKSFQSRFFSHSSSVETAESGASVTFRCDVKVNDGRQIYWMWTRGNETLVIGNNKLEGRTNNSRFRFYDYLGNTLAINPVHAADAGLFFCKTIHNPPLIKTIILKVIVPRTRILQAEQNFDSVSVPRGSTFNLTCQTVSSSKVENVIWFRKKNQGWAENLKEEKFQMILGDLMKPPLENGRSESRHILTIHNVTEEDEGSYSCYPNNWEIATIYIKVEATGNSSPLALFEKLPNSKPQTKSKPTIISPHGERCPLPSDLHQHFFHSADLINITIQVGQPVKIGCRLNIDMGNRNQRMWYDKRDSIGIVRKRAPEHSALSDAGEYVCEIFVQGQLPVSRSYFVKVVEPTARMLYQNSSQHTTLKVAEGSSFNLTCEINTLVDPSVIQWHRRTNSGVEVEFGDNVVVENKRISDSLFGSVVKLANVTAEEDSGVYFCRPDDWQGAEISVTVK